MKHRTDWSICPLLGSLGFTALLLTSFNPLRAVHAVRAAGAAADGLGVTNTLVSIGNGSSSLSGVGIHPYANKCNSAIMTLSAFNPSKVRVNNSSSTTVGWAAACATPFVIEVNWNDGTANYLTVPSSLGTYSLSHTYTTAGTKTAQLSSEDTGGLQTNDGGPVVAQQFLTVCTPHGVC